MIFSGENKSVICKGDFHPAQFYKGEKKIAGYDVTEFENTGGITLTDCYNDVIYDASLRGKNLWNGANFLKSAVGSEILRFYVYASDNEWLKSGKSFTISVTAFISENDTRTDPRLHAAVIAADGTVIVSNTVNYGEKNKEGRYYLKISMPNTTKAISHIYILFMNYSNNPGGVWDAYVKDIQIELGNTATEFELPLRNASITARGKNLWPLGHYLEAIGSNAAVYKELSAKTYPWIKSGTTFVLSLTSYVPEDSGRTLMRVTIQTVLSDDTVVNAQRIDYSAKGEEIKLSTKYTIPQTEKEIKLLRFWLMDYSNITNGVWAGYVKDVQVELGNTATEFEPYRGGQTVMFSSGTLQGEIPTFKGTTIIEFESDATVKMKGKYKKTEV